MAGHGAHSTVQPPLDSVCSALLGGAAAAARGNLIPVYTTVPADLLTPVMAYLKLSHGAELGRESFLLESVQSGQKLGRFSFLGARPFEVVRTGPGLAHEGDPLAVLEARMRPYRYVRLPELSMFTGGAVGYISFDCVQHFEPRTRRPLRDPVGVPESVHMLCDTLVAFDHVFQCVYCVSHVFLPDDAPHTRDHIGMLYGEAAAPADPPAAPPPAEHTPMPVQERITERSEPVSNVGKEGYERFVRELRQKIYEGEIFQAVPSQRLARPTKLHPFNCYRQLRRINPSPYMFYIDCGDAQLVGASPETLCQVDHGKVAVHAIAGTVRRGRNAEEDRRLAEELRSSEKDRAEHIMLVDLARNDVSRVCDPTTTTVETLMAVEQFSHVIHLTSRITGQLRANRNKYDALRSIFPAGTVSGSPKIRALELIAELEQERRGVYAGAVGRIDFAADNLDVCIAIRTMTFKNGIAYLQAGGGIVYDSNEEDEYYETVNKLGGNLRCLDQAEAAYMQ